MEASPLGNSSPLVVLEWYRFYDPKVDQLFGYPQGSGTLAPTKAKPMLFGGSICLLYLCAP